jgi:hypothetical protein
MARRLREAAVLLDAAGDGESAGALLVAAEAAEGASTLVGDAARRAQAILDRLETGIGPPVLGGPAVP